MLALTGALGEAGRRTTLSIGADEVKKLELAFVDEPGWISSR